MKRAPWLRHLPCHLVLTALLGVLASPAGPGAWAAPEAEAVSARLEDGQPLEVRLPPGRTRWTGRLEVPQDADALSVVVSGDRDVDLYVRYGRPFRGDVPDAADVSSVGEGPHELIRVTPLDEVPVRGGTWYVAVQVPYRNESGLGFEIAAFVDRVGGRRTLLPGAPVKVTIPDPGWLFTVRTWFPGRASGAVVDLEPAVLEGLRFRLEGPGGYARRDTTQQRIVLGAEEAPRGVYTMSLSPPPVPVQGRRLAARLVWTFPGGLVLPLPPSPLLEPGRPLSVLMGGPANGALQPVRIAVPEGSSGFIVQAASTAGANVDLYVRRGTPFHRKDETADWLGARVGPIETVVVRGHGPLAPGLYSADVVLVDDERPVEVVVSLTPLVAPEGPYTWGADDPPVLAPDTWAAGAVRVFDSAFSWHAVDVPAGSISLHAQLLDATGPLELVVLDPQDGRIVARAFTPLVDEHVEHDFEPPLAEDARYVVGVVNRATWDAAVSYRIAIGIDRRPTLPKDMLWPPRVTPEDLTPPERTAAATVEITIGDCSGGSGVCVTPDGLVITCRHCLRLKEGIGGVQQEGIILAFPQDLAAPPVQALYARILDEDSERDLVLLEPIHDVFNRKLPDDVVLPWLELGDSSRLRLGEEVWVAGYPQVGSECTRTAVILSHGILAGLERRADGPNWLKTDAWVAPGHSGGPLVDSEGRLMGIAAATLGQTESLGLAIPSRRLPARWQELIKDRIARWAARHGASAPGGAAASGPR